MLRKISVLIDRFIKSFRYDVDIVRAMLSGLSALDVMMVFKTLFTSVVEKA